MLYRNIIKLSQLVPVFFLLITNVFSAVSQEYRSLIVKDIHDGPLIDYDHKDVIKSKNKSGFETGQMVKLNGVYHIFINEMFDRPHRDMRISHWSSTDAESWKRESTVVQSIPGRTSTNPRSEVWVTGVEFNDKENAWNIFYVAYRAGDSTKNEISKNDYEGRIWRAKSVNPGLDGIAGPYADMDIILEPDENSQAWEGEQAVAAFNPYKVGDVWYAFYDGHNHTPQGNWPVGMATSKTLNGPWKRMPEGHNPVPISPIFNENLQVTELKDGGFLAIFDSMGDQEIAYSLSKDGINWQPEVRLKIQTENNLWADNGDHSTRTPLGAIEEKDGTFTVLYTAKHTIHGKPFFAVGKCKLAWK